MFNSWPNVLSQWFSTHDIQATYHPWDPLTLFTVTRSFKADWGEKHIIMQLTACNVPSAAAHRPARIANHSTRHPCVLHCKRITSSSQLTAFSASTPCTGTTKTCPLVFPAWSWGNRVPPLTVCYEMPNTSTGRQGDKELKFWSHGRCSINAPSPSSIPIHFTPRVILIKLPSHLHAVVLQNKRNGSQLYWKR